MSEDWWQWAVIVLIVAYLVYRNVGRRRDRDCCGNRKNGCDGCDGCGLKKKDG